MPGQRMSMRNVREILRLKLSLGLSHREAAASCGTSAGFVGGLVVRAAALGLQWEDIAALDDAALESKLATKTPKGQADRALPDFAVIDIERRRPGVTLRLLHLEYLETNPDGYQYTQFCQHYRDWLSRNKRSMRQNHKAGDKLFVDYSGKRPHFVDPATGEIIECELFVAVLGASNYTYAEATRSQQIPDWIGSHIHALEYFGGATKVIVCDQLRSGVSTPDRYDPAIQRSYERMAAHYDTAVVPARPRKPKDKAKVEVGVQVVQRWILARLRNRTFFSLGELNVAIRELLENLNHRVMRRFGASRRELFDRLDRDVLKPLPVDRYVHADWQGARVNIDYHVEFDRHFYSVPHRLVHERVEICATATTIEVFRNGVRIASHVRSRTAHHHTTVAEHMPVAHREHAEWTPSRLVAWAEKVGPSSAALVRAILESRPHPEHGYRSCLGILRLAQRYGDERLERACARAHAAGARSYRHVNEILVRQLDKLPLPEADEGTSAKAIEHKNVRGPNYYH